MNCAFDKSYTIHVTPLLYDFVYTFGNFDDWIMASLKSIVRQPDSRIRWRACVSWLSGFVPELAIFIFQGTQIIDETFLVANSNLIELSSSRIDLSEAIRQVDKVENKSFESKTMQRFTLVQMSSSIALTKTYTSSIASPGGIVSADVTDLTGRWDLWEFQENVLKVDPYSKFPQSRPARYHIADDRSVGWHLQKLIRASHGFLFLAYLLMFHAFLPLLRH